MGAYGKINGGLMPVSHSRFRLTLVDFTSNVKFSDQ